MCMNVKSDGHDIMWLLHKRCKSSICIYILNLTNFHQKQILCNLVHSAIVNSKFYVIKYIFALFSQSVDICDDRVLIEIRTFTFPLDWRQRGNILVQ